MDVNTIMVLSGVSSNQMENKHFDVSLSHAEPFPVYPALQKHPEDPSTFMHVAFE